MVITLFFGRSYVFIVSLVTQFAGPTLWKEGKEIQNCQEWARETGLSVREVEWRIDAELFLNEYPRWELGTPHQSVILHEMFLHAAEQGQKEAERLIQWGC